MTAGHFKLSSVVQGRKKTPLKSSNQSEQWAWFSLYCACFGTGAQYERELQWFIKVNLPELDSQFLIAKSVRLQDSIAFNGLF